MSKWKGFAMLQGVDIQSLNRSYLVILRDAVKSDQAQACLSFGIDEKLANRIAEMSLKDIDDAASTEQVLFRTSLTSDLINNLLRIADPIKKSVLATLTGV